MRNDTLVVGMLLLGLLVGIVGATLLNDYMEPRAQRDARALVNDTVTPDESVTRAQARHACQRAAVSLRAVAERLQEPESVVHRYREDDDE